ncbi:vasopressin V1b receptor-like [Mya arenaria]|uniref:vasopressin V1b receptor-like n=1 Tax=Mya arenaria TaxID=6604 RepID=UPI0022E35F85|nr:vasopressin V1b receptor-like [Mya arenaria]
MAVLKYFKPDVFIYWECRPLSKNELYQALYFGYLIGVLFVLPALIMLATYGLSCRGLWRSTLASRTLQGVKRETYVKCGNGRHSVNTKTSPRDDDVTSRRRVIKALILIVIVFIVCWGARLTVQVMNANNMAARRGSLQPLITEGLTYLSSALNPFLFMAMSSQFCPRAHCCCRLIRGGRIPRGSTGGSTIKSTSGSTATGIASNIAAHLDESSACI